MSRLPDGETGIRKSWIKFLQDVLAENPAIELATDVPPFKFVQWDGKVVREIPRLRIKQGMTPNRKEFKTGYADMAIASFAVFDRMQKDGIIPDGVKFQISIPTPIAPTYNNMVPADRPNLLPALTQHFVGEVASYRRGARRTIASPSSGTSARKFWPGKVITSPARSISVPSASMYWRKIGDAVPSKIDLGYHLCYGSPADEHMVQPKDAGLMVEMVNAVVARVRGRFSSSICQCRRAAPMTRFSRHWKS